MCASVKKVVGYVQVSGRASDENVMWRTRAMRRLQRGWGSGILHKLTRRCSGRVSAGREQRPPGHRVVAVDGDGSLGTLVVVMTSVVGLNPRVVGGGVKRQACHELTVQLRFGVRNVDFVSAFSTILFDVFQMSLTRIECT